MSNKIILPPGAFRLALAAAVLVSHVSRFNIGVMAVLLFFYLSGYWVSKIWREKFANRDLGRFYASRYFRIMPLYLAVMILAAVVNRMALHPQNFTLLGLDTMKGDTIGTAWSLDIELQFYLLVPLIVPVLARLPAWAGIVLTTILAVIGWSGVFAFHVHTVAQYLPVFAFGSLTDLKAWKPGRAFALGSLGLFAAFTGVLALMPWTGALDTHRSTIGNDVFHILAFFWMLPVLPYAAHSLTVRSDKLDRHLGNLSYPLYLVHMPVIFWMEHHLAFTLGLKMLAVAISAGMALGLYLLVDRPIDRVRVDLLEGNRSTPRLVKGS